MYNEQIENIINLALADMANSHFFKKNYQHKNLDNNIMINTLNHCRVE